MTISVFDIAMAQGKKAIIAEADKDVAKVDGQYTQGLITDEERYKNVIRVWQKATGDISTAMMEELNTKKDGRDPQFHPLLMMTNSGARGNKGNIGQLGAMRGLMADPSGRIIDVPVKSNFREGMTVLEYFISTHGARKGLADTALRTADLVTSRAVSLTLRRTSSCASRIAVPQRRRTSRSPIRPTSRAPSGQSPLTIPT